MTRVVTEQFLTRFAAANYNEPSRGVNGSDHMTTMSIAPVGREAGLGGTSPAAAAPFPPATDPQIAEGYSSAAGLGLVLVTTAAGGAVAAVTVVVRVVLGILG
jgi:hypothetical protein